jgi:hypothetical protein
MRTPSTILLITKTNLEETDPLIIKAATFTVNGKLQSVDIYGGDFKFVCLVVENNLEFLQLIENKRSRLRGEELGIYHPKWFKEND